MAQANYRVTARITTVRTCVFEVVAEREWQAAVGIVHNAGTVHPDETIGQPSCHAEIIHVELSAAAAAEAAEPAGREADWPTPPQRNARNG